ncbi:MAG: acyl carrier protein [Lachnospiraceae bacterium]|nr:acyl carrier protein [Lachnospiraceae bacterium]
MMSKENICDEMINLIQIIGRPNDPTEEMPEVDDFLLNMDSLRFIELVTAIENKYRITMSSENMMKFKSGNLENIIDIIQSQLLEKEKSDV